MNDFFHSANSSSYDEEKKILLADLTKKNATISQQQREIERLTLLYTNAQNEASNLQLQIDAWSSQKSANSDSSNSPQKNATSSELTDYRLQLQLKDQEIQELRSEMQKLRQLVANHEASMQTLQRTNATLEEEDAKLREMLTTLETELDTFRSSSGSSKDDLVIKAKSSVEAESYRLQAEQLKRQLLLFSETASRKHASLQAELQATRNFLEEVKREFSHFMDTSREETEAFRIRASFEYDKLSSEFSDFKNMSYEEKKELLRDHQEVLYALQSQFDEYRATAEYLFNAEAARLEDKLNAQMIKYGQEIQFITKMKDQAYDEMLSMKDAKIMSLIEGSDFSNLAEKHVQELAQMEQRMLREVDRQKRKQEDETALLVSEMDQRYASLRADAQNSLQQISILKEKLAQSTSVIRNKQAELEDGSKKHTAEVKTLNSQLNVARNQVEALSQEKARLRHKVARMKLELSGEGSETYESVVKRLASKTATLSLEQDVMMSKYDEMKEVEKNLREQNLQLSQSQLYHTLELNKLREQNEQTVRTLEAFLHYRAKELSVDEALMQLFTSVTVDAQLEAQRVPPEEYHVDTSDLPLSEVSTADSTVRKQQEMLLYGIRYLKKFQALNRALVSHNVPQTLPAHREKSTIQLTGFITGQQDQKEMELLPIDGRAVPRLSLDESQPRRKTLQSMLMQDHLSSPPEDSEVPSTLDLRQPVPPVSRKPPVGFREFGTSHHRPKKAATKRGGHKERSGA